MSQQTNLVCPYCGGKVLTWYKKKYLYKCITGSHTGPMNKLIEYDEAAVMQGLEEYKKMNYKGAKFNE